MGNPTLFTKWRNLLAALYADEASARRIVADAGLDARRIRFNTEAIHFWHSILVEAIQTEKFDLLLEVTLHEYATNQELQAAYEAYRKFVEDGGRLTINTIERVEQHTFSLTSLQTLYQNSQSYLKQHYWLLSLIVALEIFLGLFFYQHKERFLTSWWLYSISWWGCLAAMLLLIVVIWRWRCVYQDRIAISLTRTSLVITCLLTSGWTGLIIALVWCILNPQQLSPHKFGIAVAAFGEGPNFRNTERTRELSSLLLADLQDTIENKPELVNNIELQKIGIIQNAEQGAKIGKLVGAKLILWGRILEQDKGTVVHLQVLESPGFTDDSALIRVLPIDLPALHSSIDLKDLDILTVKEVASKQNLGLASFCLGLYYYLEQQKIELAAKQFEFSLNFLQATEPFATEMNLGLIYYYLGRSYQLQGKYEESQEMLKKAAYLNPADLAAILGQVYNYDVMNLGEQKRTTANKVLDLSYQHPFNDTVIYDRALAYEALEDYDNALREYRAILKCESNDFARCQSNFFIAYLSAARVLLHLDRVNEARILYDKAEILAQGDSAKIVSFTLDIGNFYENLGDLARAEQAYSKAIDLNPTLATPYFYRARVHDKKNAMDAAFLDYQEFSELSDNLSYANIRFAGFLDRVGLDELALDKYYEALRHTTDKQIFIRALIYAYLGRILAELGRVTEAIAAFEHSLEINPNLDASTTLNLSQLYESTGQVSKANDLYESLMKERDQLSEDEFKILQIRLNALNTK